MYDSPLVTVVYSIVVTGIVAFIGFTVVVTIGGIYDLIYLFRELNEEVLDETDDGRVHKEDK